MKLNTTICFNIDESKNMLRKRARQKSEHIESFIILNDQKRNPERDKGDQCLTGARGGNKDSM